MDTDWCLNCDRHVEGNALYCSFNCKHLAGPHNDDANDDDHSASIMAWAAAIPGGPPSPQPSVHSSSSSTHSSIYRPPQLLRPHRPVPPTLCMSTPTTAARSPTIPILASHRRATCPSTPSSSDSESIGKASLLSGATEPSLATPASANPMPLSASHSKSVFGSIASHVRSWVSPTPPLVYSSKPKQPAPPPRVDTAKFTVLSQKHHLSPLKSPSYHDDDTSPVCWMSSTILVETKSAFSQPKPPRGRRRAPELSPRNDDHPSYRARGRKASRAVD